MRVRNSLAGMKRSIWMAMYVPLETSGSSPKCFITGVSEPKTPPERTPPSTSIIVASPNPL